MMSAFLRLYQKTSNGQDAKCGVADIDIPKWLMAAYRSRQRGASAVGWLAAVSVFHQTIITDTLPDIHTRPTLRKPASLILLCSFA
jgi:hypothetical protein